MDVYMFVNTKGHTCKVDQDFFLWFIKRIKKRNSLKNITRQLMKFWIMAKGQRKDSHEKNLSHSLLVLYALSILESSVLTLFGISTKILN